MSGEEECRVSMEVEEQRKRAKQQYHKRAQKQYRCGRLCGCKTMASPSRTSHVVQLLSG